MTEYFENQEWLAWRQVCKQLQKLNVDINKQEALACAIRLWGERLHQLRLENPKFDDSALAEHVLAYEDYVLDNWAP